MTNLLNFVFTKKNCYFFFLIITLLVCFVSQKIYEFDLDLNIQDGGHYKLISEDLRNFFYVRSYYSSRILGPFLAWLMQKLFFIKAYYAFLSLVCIFFYLLQIITFNFLSNKTKVYWPTFSFVILIYFSNWVILYNFFNPYQLVDLLCYFFSLLLIISTLRKQLFYFFSFSFFAILNKHYMIILVFLCSIQLFFNVEKKYRKQIIFFFFLVFALLALIQKFSGVYSSSPSETIFTLSFEWILDKLLELRYFFTIIFNDLNIFYLLPFIFLIFVKDNINIIIKNHLIVSYFYIMTVMLVVMHLLFGAENFPRIFFQAFYVVVILLSINFIKNNNSRFFNIVLFLSPILILIEYAILFFNIKFTNSGFVNYMHFDRPFNFISFYYTGSALFLFLIFENKLFKKYEKNFK